MTEKHDVRCTLLFLVLLVITVAMGPAFAQAPPRHKILTPEQKKFQAEAAEWQTQHNALRAQAQAASMRRWHAEK